MLCLYYGGGRLATICNLKAMRRDLQADETELLAMTDATIHELENMTDKEFAAMDMLPDIPLEAEYGT